MEARLEEAAAWNGSADLVTCFEVIEHVHAPVDFVRALLALAKPGGYVLVTGLGTEGFDIQILWERSKSISPPHHLNFLSVEGYERLFARVGFVEIEVRTPGRLDLDIVRNAWLADPSVLNGDRFVRLLLRKRDAAVHERFQQFLAENHLSSHVRVLARRPLAQGQRTP
jgi:SAM-dependent methyltransferase